MDCEIHNSQVSIAKAILMILVVVGHSGCPAYICDFIYLFHVPAFFFVSGYLFKERHLDDFKGFVVKKIRSLYFPYVLWSTIFLIFTNFFFRIGFIDYSISWNDFLNGVAKIIVFTGHQPLLNAFWFLKTLFFSLIFCWIIIKILKNYSFYSVPVLLLAAIMFRYLPHDFNMIFRIILASAFFLSGYEMKKREKMVSWRVSIVCLLIVICVSRFFNANFFMDGPVVLLYYPIAIIGTMGILGLSSVFNSKVLDSIGNMTIGILTFHYLGFKIASILKIAWFNMPAEALAKCPVISENNEWFWVVYCVFGVLFPVGLSWAKNKILLISCGRQKT